MTKLTPEEVLKQSFDCCRQIVRSYGGSLPEHVRENFCSMMDFYEKNAKLDDGNEVKYIGIDWGKENKMKTADNLKLRKNSD